MLPNLKDLIQWGTALLLIAVSSRLRLAPVFGYLFAWQLPFVLLDQRALLPYTVALWALPAASIVACLSARFCPQPGCYSKLAMFAVCLLYADLLLSYCLSGNWDVYHQLLSFGFGLTCAFTLRSKGEFWACALMLGLYLAADSLGYAFQGQQMANTDILGIDRAVNEVIGDRNYKAFGFAVGVMLGVSLVLYNKSALSELHIPQSFGAVLGSVAKPVGAAIVVTCGYALLQTQSRSGIIILIAAFLAFALHSSWRSANALKTICVSLSFAMLAVLAAGQLLSGLSERLVDADMSTAGGRVEIWQAAVEAITDGGGSTLLFGYGPAGTETVIGGSPHNGFLRILCDQGLFGLCWFLLLLAAVTWNSWLAKGPTGHLQFALAILLTLGSLSIEPHYFMPITGIVLGLCCIQFDRQPQVQHRAPWTIQTERGILPATAQARATIQS